MQKSIYKSVLVDEGVGRRFKIAGENYIYDFTLQISLENMLLTYCKHYLLISKITMNLIYKTGIITY